MAFPSIRGSPTAGNSGGSDVTSVAVTLPASGLNDLVFVYVVLDGTITAPTEATGRWGIDSQADPGGNVTLVRCNAVQDNSLPDLALTLSWTGAQNVAWLAYAVQGWNDLEEAKGYAG